MTAPRRILITGATGFTGRHLSRLALAQGTEVFGFARRAAFLPGVVGATGDVTDGATLGRWIRHCAPDWIFHLAAAVRGTPPFTEEEFERINVQGTATLLEQVRVHAPAAQVLVLSSSAIYAPPPEPDRPLDENASIAPLNAYGRSKAAQDRVAADFSRETGLHVVRARPFNQCGPGEPAALVCGSLARQLARIEAGFDEPLVRVVTLGARRDFCDVRDVTAGCWALLERGAAGEAYNVCSGVALSVGEIIDLLRDCTRRRGFAVVEASADPPEGVLRCQVGDASRLRTATDWAPRIPVARSLADLLAESRAQLRPAS